MEQVTGGEFPKRARSIVDLLCWSDTSWHRSAATGSAVFPLIVRGSGAGSQRQRSLLSRLLGDGVGHVGEVDGDEKARACRASAQTGFSASRMVAEHLERYGQLIRRVAGERAA